MTDRFFVGYFDSTQIKVSHHDDYRMLWIRIETVFCLGSWRLLIGAVMTTVRHFLHLYVDYKCFMYG